MKKILISLLAIVIAAALLLALNFGLNGVAKANEEKAMAYVTQTMLPGSETFTEETYTGEDTNIVRAWKGETGFVVETKTYGYADDITLLVSVTNEGKVVGLKVLDMHETPGLGGNILTEWLFLARFLNTTGGVAIGAPDAEADAFSSATGTDTAQTETYIDGMSGATVTSKAIARCVNSAVGYVTGADVESSATTWGG